MPNLPGWLLIVPLLSVILSACDRNEPVTSIGTAEMEADSTIILRLHARTDEGAIGETLLSYPPGSDGYGELLNHLGGLQPGQSKPVPPWPETVSNADGSGNV
jgi:hypothetical protein